MHSDSLQIGSRHYVSVAARRIAQQRKPPLQPCAERNVRRDCSAVADQGGEGLTQECRQQDGVSHQGSFYSRVSADRVVGSRAAVTTSRELAARQVSAARHANLSNNVGLFAAKVQALTTLLPRLTQDRLLRMDPELLCKLIHDLDEVALRLVQLRDYFPSADLQEMVCRRPALLLAEEFAEIPAAREALVRTFPGADVDHMVTLQPLLLVEDVEAAIEELRRLMPNADPLQTLRFNPHMLVSVMSNRKLSLW